MFMCQRNKKKALTQLNVCVLHAHCYRGRIQTFIFDCQRKWLYSSRNALL